jgi:anti-anti-sigma regulatory factor
MVTMTLVPCSDVAVIALAGALDHVDDAVAMADAIDFVGDEHHLVVDLAAVERIAEPCLSIVAAALAERPPWTETVVVSPDPQVRMQLVLADIDRRSPVVLTVRQAIDFVEARTRTATSALGV